MPISFWTIGKTNSKEFQQWEADFLRRIKAFIPFRTEVIDISRSIRDKEVLKLEEAKKVLQKVKSNDFLILLDEKGKGFSSRGFAAFIQDQLSFNTGKNIVFLVGGAFGFHETVYQRANAQISLSEMTFSHQLIRVVFLEQLYRAFTIINNHPYHND
ncbi:MAG: 23S rRNA (pseudouridine(1915)-N(3))-methyltransferase RlmH [Saprospiraceae bacterium]|nr:23S rRNA (pseudouridine(1915)-N(3))-methyltransferase RlmH [Saprospiraceae bacterium]